MAFGLTAVIARRVAGAVTARASHFARAFHHGPLGQDGLPLSVDWRANGVMDKHIQDQGRAGICWAVTATGAVQAINVIKGNDFVELSVQQLVDCVNVSSNIKKGSGNCRSAFEYIANNGGQLPRQSYPKVFGKQRPQIVLGKGVTINGLEAFRDVTNEDLKKMVSRQPVVAAVGADSCFKYAPECENAVIAGPPYDIWQMLQHKMAHQVLIVGFGTTEDGEDYWKVQNSWGEKFGYMGCCLITRDLGHLGGAFGINRYICFPVKDNCPNSPWVLTKSESRMRLTGYYVSDPETKEDKLIKSMLIELEATTASLKKRGPQRPIFIMKVIAAYMLSFFSGNISPRTRDLKKLLDSVRVKADTMGIESTLKSLEEHIEKFSAGGGGTTEEPKKDKE